MKSFCLSVLITYRFPNYRSLSAILVPDYRNKDCGNKLHYSVRNVKGLYGSILTLWALDAWINILVWFYYTSCAVSYEINLSHTWIQFSLYIHVWTLDCIVWTRLSTVDVQRDEVTGWGWSYRLTSGNPSYLMQLYVSSKVVNKSS